MDPRGMRIGNRIRLTVWNIIASTLHLIVMVIKFSKFIWAGYVARMDLTKNAFNILTGKRTRKRQSRTPGRK